MTTIKKENFADLLRDECKNLNGVVYFTKPYSCAMTEALGYFSNYDIPDSESVTITREDKSITVSIKPKKGSGKRKPFVITMYVP